MQDEAAVVKEAKPLQSARFNSYTKAGIDPVEAFALLSSTDASNYFDMVLACGLRNGEESKVAAELFVKEMWYSVSHVLPSCTRTKALPYGNFTRHPCYSMLVCKSESDRQRFARPRTGCSLLMCCPEAGGHRLQGLCLDLKNLRLSPRLLARLAHQVAGKPELHRVTKQLLPDLCQARSSSFAYPTSPLHASELVRYLRPLAWPYVAASILR